MTSSGSFNTEQLYATIQQLEAKVAELTGKIELLENTHPQSSGQSAEEILAHKKVEEAIERGKREWEASFDAVMDMVILTDETNIVIRCNAATCRYLTKNYSQLLNRPIHELFFGDQPGSAQVFDSNFHEVQFSKLPGWFYIANYPVMLKDSAFGTVHVLTDITESRKAQEKLRESEEKLRKINDELETRVRLRTRELVETNQELEKEIKAREGVQAVLAKEKELLSITLLSIQDGVISTDRDGVITLFNQAAEAITGCSQADALGKPLHDTVRIIDEKANQISAEPLFKLLDKTSAKPLEHLTLLNRSGGKLLISGSSAPVRNNAGELVGYVMILENITEQKRIEAQLMLSQKMESVGLLAAGIAHEINTPMQYIGDNTNFFKEAFQALFDIHQAYAWINSSDLDLDTVPEMITKVRNLEEKLDLEFYISEIPAAIQQSLDGIDRVRKIVLAMKSFSHPGQKEKRPADINQAINTTVTITRNEWKYIADLKTELDPNLPLVNCEINEINQVILNMVINSCQAIQEARTRGKSDQGRILIRTRAHDAHIEICIQDSGMGIPAANLARIFDPFFTTKELGKGTGQGLSLAHNVIVNQHNGSIQVESELGKGTTFTIQLPVSAQVEAEQEEQV